MLKNNTKIKKEKHTQKDNLKDTQKEIIDDITNDNLKDTQKEIIDDITEEIIQHIHKIVSLPNNTKRINTLLSYFMNHISIHISPYLYTILALLIIMFLMNCFQFYYYVKLFLDNRNNK